MSRNRTIVLALAAGALLRIAYVLSSRELPFFEFPITDALFHHRLASAIASGFWWDGEAYFRAPLYYYLLGGLYSVFGPHVIVGKILGHVAGLVTGGVIIAWADQLWGRRGAVLAAVLWLGSGFLLFYEGELLVDSVFTCLLFSSIYVQSNTRWRFHEWISGALFGLAVITRPTALICLPMMLYRAVRGSADDPAIQNSFKRSVWAWAGAFVVPVAVVVAMNSFALGRLTGVATSGGINFYIGNHEGADGGSATLPEPWGYAWSYRSLSDYAARESGRSLDAAEVSDFYYDEGLHFLRDHPGEAAELWLRKAQMSVGRIKLSDNLNLPFVMDRLVLLRVLWVWVGFLFIVAAAALPLWRSVPPDARWLWGYVASYLVVLVAYFTTDRFRLPLVPALIVLATGTPWLWWQALPKLRMKAALAAAVTALIALPNWYGVSASTALAYFNLGNVTMRQGQTDEALQWYDSAVAMDPRLHQLRLNRGWVRLRAGDRVAARADFQEEARAFPQDARPFNNLAALNLLEGDTAAALADVDSGLARDSSLGVLYLQRLRVAAARADVGLLRSDLDRARHHAPGWPVWTYWEAELQEQLGRPAEARRLLTEYRGQSRWPEIDFEDETYSGPDPAQIDYRLGLTWLGEQQVDSAEAYFARAARADSSFAEAWSNWGTAAVAKGEFENAVSRYRQALKMAPRSPLLLTNLAWAQLALGQADSAQAHLVEALRIDSTFAPAAALLNDMRQHSP